ncbi:MAG: ATP-binding protein [Leptolyngbyaceae bacterium]|nr:ATP-binding protein [Leptolyngbyaceae bacterium]
MPTLIASPKGLERIHQARREKDWGWSTDDDDRCLLTASQFVDSTRTYEAGGPYANGISGGTWKRFLGGRHPIRATAFKAYCQALGLQWHEVITRDNAVPNARYQNWGEAPELSSFCGRSPELDKLNTWLTADQCRLIGVSGMAGMGKTSLVVKAAEAVQDKFDVLVYRSLQSASPPDELLSELADELNNSANGAEGEAVLPSASSAALESVDGCASTILEHLRDRRCLLILDDVESVLQSGELVGQYRSGYEAYGLFLRRIGTERHQSCVILISREHPREVSAFASAGHGVRELNLGGMSMTDGKVFLEATGLVKRGSTFDALIQRYRGNPSALRVVSKLVQEFFGGDVIQFMSQSTVFVTDVVTELLAQQISRLSGLESEVMYWLAIACQPISLNELKSKLWRSVSTAELLSALQSLQRRSLIEKDSTHEGNEAIFTLQPVVMKFVTTQFIQRVCRDIQQLVKAPQLEYLGVLKTHALVSDRGDPGDLQAIQVRTILNRVCDRLYEQIHPDQLHTCLQDMLALTQGQPRQVIGYAEYNMKMLLNR